MLRAWKKLLVPPERPLEASAGYIALLKAARNPFFFEHFAVPDTLDGRFELIMLHMSLLQHRLNSDPVMVDFAQAITDECFIDMDRALRELGIFNTARRLKRMVKAYHGRLQAYSQSFAEPELLKAALARNLYGTMKDGDVALLDKAARYVRQVHAHLTTTPDTIILSGHYSWPEPAGTQTAPSF